MKKRLALILILLVALAVFSGCGSSRLSDIFDETAVIGVAEGAIDRISGGDYEGLTAMVREDLQPLLTAEALESAVTSIMPDAGAFVEFTKTTVAGKTDSDGVDSAIAVITAKYEKQSVTYTVVMNESYEITGFYMK